MATVERDAGQRRLRMRIGGERRERGIGGCTVWPTARARSKPKPVLPVAGTDRPPVATTTRSASRSPSSPSVRRQRPSARTHAVDGRAEPALDAERHGPRHQRVAHVARAVRGREVLAALGLERQRHAEHLVEVAPLLAQRPGAEQPRARAPRGASLTKRSGAAVTGSTLQRPPPLMRILRPPSACLLDQRHAGARPRAPPARPSGRRRRRPPRRRAASRASSRPRGTGFASITAVIVSWTIMSLARTLLLAASDSRWLRETRHQGAVRAPRRVDLHARRDAGRHARRGRGAGRRSASARSSHGSART